ncbi:MAG: DUF2752 domain-containing protein [Opitutia bacterium]|jgi:hypothetical protein
MQIRLVRRPLLPGEFDAEKWVPLALVASCFAAWVAFRLGLTTPGCGFRRLTDLPCLACGGTRSARSLLAADFLSALAFNPLFVLTLGLAVLWSAWAVFDRIRGQSLRVRLVTDPAGSRLLRWGLAIGLIIHWMWLAWTLPA